MKKLLAVLLAVPTLALAAPRVGVVYDYPIVRVIDGDTVVVSTPFLPLPLKPQLSVRIYGVDTPEKGSTAKCPAEIEKGKAASAFTSQLVKAAKDKKVSIIDWDKYGGRVLGDIILDDKPLSTSLIDNGYAYAYFGGAKRSWCK
jgi:endonuclease YncB( thermonuclease family)